MDSVGNLVLVHKAMSSSVSSGGQGRRGEQQADGTAEEEAKVVMDLVRALHQCAVIA